MEGGQFFSFVRDLSREAPVEFYTDEAVEPGAHIGEYHKNEGRSHGNHPRLRGAY